MDRQIIPLAETSRWEKALETFEGGDVYYRPGYLRVLEERGEGRPVLIFANEAGKSACHVTLARPLPDFPDSPEGTDLVSPYGYAGPLVFPKNRDTALWFKDVWEWAAGELGAVAEFVRFHPLLENHLPFESDGNVEKFSETVVMDLGSDISRGLSKTCEKNLKIARKHGVKVVFDPDGGVSRFADLYAETMQRKGAGEYYHFPRSYFLRLSDALGENLWVVLAVHDGRDVAGALIMRHGGFIHYHLGGSRHASRALCPTNLLLVEIARRAKKLGARFFHLGGGFSPNDGLFHFKSGFSKKRADFFVGKIVFQNARYARLLEKRKSQGPLRGDFFPAYREPVR